MSLYETVKKLDSDQLEFIYQIFNLEKSNYSVKSLYFKLEEFTENNLKLQKSSELGKVKDRDILYIWRESFVPLLNKINTDNELTSLKEKIIQSLNSILFYDDNIEEKELDIILKEICRNTLVLQWKSLSVNEQQKFVEVLNKDLKEYIKKLTKEELERILFGHASMGFIGITPLFIPMVAKMMFKRLTQGFMGWLLIVVLGREAGKKALLAFLAGPIGWAINIALFLTLGLTVIFKYNSHIQKIHFITAIFGIYCFAYYNERFKE